MSAGRAFVVVVALAVASAACASAKDADDADDTEDALIGGQAGALAKFPSTVYLKGSCTAAKVAPKLLLTAAHCVLDPATLDLRYQGKTVSVTRDPSQGYVDLPVAQVFVHPDWVKGCTSSYCAASAVTAKLDAPDVAVIELATDDDDIPVTPVANAAVALAVNDRVTVVGYGCTVGVLVPDTRDVASLKYANTRLVDASHAVHDGSPLVVADVPQVAGLYNLTAGPGAAKARAGLCPGDSGGPLYATRSGRLVVVGVNSNYTLGPDTSDQVGLPVTNWHTRLDDASSHAVGAWLRSVGVPTSGS